MVRPKGWRLEFMFDLPGTYERCLSGHYYAVVRGDEECPVCKQIQGLRREIDRLRALLEDGQDITIHPSQREPDYSFPDWSED